MTDHEMAEAVESVLGGDDQCEACGHWSNDTVRVEWGKGRRLCRLCEGAWTNLFNSTIRGRHSRNDQFDRWFAEHKRRNDSIRARKASTGTEA